MACREPALWRDGRERGGKGERGGRRRGEEEAGTLMESLSRVSVPNRHPRD